MSTERVVKNLEKAQQSKMQTVDLGSAPILDSDLLLDESKSIFDLLNDYERQLVSGLPNKLGTMQFQYNDLTLPAAGAYLTYTGAEVKKISFFLINENIGDGVIGHADTLKDNHQEGQVILNLYEIQSFLIDVCASELNLNVSLEEALAMVFYEESHHLRQNSGERENDVFLIQALPDKLAVLKVYAMCRSLYFSQNSDKIPSSGYQESFDNYQKYMNQIGINDYRQLDVQKVFQIVDLIRKDNL